MSTTMRRRQSVRAGLGQAAGRARRSVSDVAQELIEDGLRMRECPGIYFGTEPAGRTAKVAGTGLGVREVLRNFVRDEDVERLRRACPQLSALQITAAMLCFNRYPEEIRRQVEASAALTPEALAQRYPGLVRVVTTG